MAQDNIFKSKWISFASTTTLHGLNHTVEVKGHTLKKILWTTLVLCMLSVFIYFLVTGLMTYYKYPVTTTIEQLTVKELEFPSVTICNNNHIRKSFIQKLNDSFVNDVISVLGGLKPTAINFSDPENMEKVNWMDMFDFIKQGAHQMDEMFLECSFMGANLSSKPCKFHPELFVTQVTSMGFCFTFHPSSYIEKYGALVSIRDGADGGLYLRINLEQYEYLIGSYSVGIKVLVHDPSEEPLVQEHGMSVSPGSQTRVVIRREEWSNLEAPYGKSGCIQTEKTTYKNPLKSTTQYSNSACRKECIIKFLTAKCGCVPYFYHVPNFTTVCKVFSFSTCTFPALDTYYQNPDIYENCDCYHPCHQIKYQAMQSSATYPNDHVAVSFAKELDIEQGSLSTNILELRIFYGALVYTKLAQNAAYPIGSFYADMGGLLGLFLGASCLTIIEACEFLLTSCFTVWCKRICKTKTDMMQGAK